MYIYNIYINNYLPTDCCNVHDTPNTLLGPAKKPSLLCFVEQRIRIMACTPWGEKILSFRAIATEMRGQIQYQVQVP